MPRILRTRYIPNETIDISGDTLLYRNDALLVTEWTPIHPRKDVMRGQSCTFLEEGIKASRFIGLDGKLRYWYFDLVQVLFDPTSDTYQLLDLLADVRVWPDGRVEVVDLEELADALEQGLIRQDQAISALRILDKLLRQIDEGTMPNRAETEIFRFSVGSLGHTEG